MIIMIQPKPGRLCNKEAYKEDAWVSLRRKNRKRFVGGLGASRIGSRRDQVSGER